MGGSVLFSRASRFSILSTSVPMARSFMLWLLPSIVAMVHAVGTCDPYTCPSGKTCRHAKVTDATECSQTCSDVEGLNTVDWNNENKKCDCKDGSSTRDLCTDADSSVRGTFSMVSFAA